MSSRSAGGGSGHIRTDNRSGMGNLWHMATRGSYMEACTLSYELNGLAPGDTISFRWRLQSGSVGPGYVGWASWHFQDILVEFSETPLERSTWTGIKQDSL